MVQNKRACTYLNSLGAGSSTLLVRQAFPSLSSLCLPLHFFVPSHWHPRALEVGPLLFLLITLFSFPLLYPLLTFLDPHELQLRSLRNAVNSQPKSNFMHNCFEICHPAAAGYAVGLQYAVKKYWCGKHVQSAPQSHSWYTGQLAYLSITFRRTCMQSYNQKSKVQSSLRRVDSR